MFALKLVKERAVPPALLPKQPTFHPEQESVKTTPMKKKFALLAVCLCGLLATGCSDNDEPTGGGGGGGGGGALTPTEQKQKLENIGTEFIGKVNADDQKQLIGVLDYFQSEYGDYELGYTTDDEGGSGNNHPADVQRLAEKITRAVNGDMRALAMLGDPDSEIYQLSDHYATYTADKTYKLWIHSPGGDRIEFNFKNAANQTCLFTLTESGTKTSIPLDDRKTVVVPEKLTLKILENGIQLALVELHPFYSMTSSSQTVSVRSILETYGNNVKYRWETQTSVNNSEASVSYTLAKQSETLSSSSMYVHGSNLIDRLMGSNNSEKGIEESLGKAELSADILGKLQLKGGCSNVASLLQIDEEMDDSEASVREAAVAVNKLLDINLYYDKSSTVQAKFLLDPAKGTYTDYKYVNGEWQPYEATEWYLEPVIEFTSDGTKLSVESYFGQSGFDTLISRFKDMGDSFKNLFQ